MIKILQKFVPKGPIDNKSILVKVMAWHLVGAKPLPEPILTTSICQMESYDHSEVNNTL